MPCSYPSFLLFEASQSPPSQQGRIRSRRRLWIIVIATASIFATDTYSRRQCRLLLPTRPTAYYCNTFGLALNLACWQQLQPPPPPPPLPTIRPWWLATPDSPLPPSVQRRRRTRPAAVGAQSSRPRRSHGTYMLDHQQAAQPLPQRQEQTPRSPSIRRRSAAASTSAGLLSLHISSFLNMCHARPWHTRRSQPSARRRCQWRAPLHMPWRACLQASPPSPVARHGESASG